MRTVPLIEFSLQAISLSQQSGVLWREVICDLRKTFPEAFAINARAGKDLILNELMQNGCHLQSVTFGACCHDRLPVK